MHEDRKLTSTIEPLTSPDSFMVRIVGLMNAWFESPRCSKSHSSFVGHPVSTSIWKKSIPRRITNGRGLAEVNFIRNLVSWGLVCKRQEKICSGLAGHPEPSCHRQWPPPRFKLNACLLAVSRPDGIESFTLYLSVQVNSSRCQTQ